MWRLLVLCTMWGSPCAAGTRYTFFRGMGGARGWGAPAGGETRRVFGGASAELSSYPAACVLLDRYWTVRCSGAVVAPRWVLTAAHCVSPHLAYVKYNARRPAAPDGDVATVHYLYRHPGYRVVQEDEGRGVDVTLLHHDVGLVRTRRDMRLSTPLPVEPLHAMKLYNPLDLNDACVEVLGFGRTERSSLGEELFSVRLRMTGCERGAWFHCMCGKAKGLRADGAEDGASTDAGAGLGESDDVVDKSLRGVCSGDSGGPVLYHGAQVGITSMGPIECASDAKDPAEGATSVFTTLYHYAELVNATINDTETAMRMKRIRGEAPRRHGLSLTVTLLAATATAMAHIAPFR